jgi:hypothetical protein
MNQDSVLISVPDRGVQLNTQSGANPTGGERGSTRYNNGTLPTTIVLLYTSRQARIQTPSRIGARLDMYSEDIQKLYINRCADLDGNY